MQESIIGQHCIVRGVGFMRDFAQSGVLSHSASCGTASAAASEPVSPVSQ